jgi:integrase
MSCCKFSATVNGVGSKTVTPLRHVRTLTSEQITLPVSREGQKSVKPGFSANSLAQTFALLYRKAGIEGASSDSGRRSFLTRLANQGTAIHLLKTLAGHRRISTTAAIRNSCGLWWN